MDIIAKPNRLFEFSENHPHFLLIVTAILCVVVIVLVVKMNWKFANTTRKKKTDPVGDEMDELIEKIHARQEEKS